MPDAAYGLVSGRASRTITELPLSKHEKTRAWEKGDPGPLPHPQAV
jgi:hypothetical protein